MLSVMITLTSTVYTIIPLCQKQKPPLDGSCAVGCVIISAILQLHCWNTAFNDTQYYQYIRLTYFVNLLV